MYKAVVTDLDGTLLDENHSLNEYTVGVIRRIVEKGIKFYIATGRNYIGAKEIMDKIDLEIPLITSNGARILNSKGEEIYRNNLKNEYIQKILEVDFKRIDKDIILNGYSKGSWFVVENIEKLLKRSHKIQRPVQISMKEFKSKEYEKIFFVGPHESLVKLENEYKKIFGEDINIVFVMENSLELFSKDSNKATAAEFLLKKDGLTLDDVVAFGDGFNDYELIKKSKKGYIMGNGIYRLKEALPDYEIILPNSESGEAKKLEEIFLKNNNE